MNTCLAKYSINSTKAVSMQYSSISFSKTLLFIGVAPIFSHASAMKTDLSQANPSNGQYIVVLKAPARVSGMSQQAFDNLQADFVTIQAQQLSQQVGATVTQQYSRLLDGFVVQASNLQAQQLSKQANVAYVVPNDQVSIIPVTSKLKKNHHQQKDVQN